MDQIVITAESGSDISPKMAEQYGIFIVPMHITMGNEDLDDGSFPPEDVCTYYEKNGEIPKTSGSTPEDFSRVFDEIHEKWPEAKILHLAYSAVTTVSFSSAKIAAQGRSYVTVLDTKQVSAGQLAVVTKVADAIKRHPEWTIEEAGAYAENLSDKMCTCFIPQDLKYLRAGGRCSNAAYLGGQILNLHPCIEMQNGRLIATKKYRGSLSRVVPKLVREYSIQKQLEKEHIWLLWSVGLPEEIKTIAEETVRACGFESFEWVQTGCVITTHGGPGCFGMAAVCADR